MIRNLRYIVVMSHFYLIWCSSIPTIYFFFGRGETYTFAYKVLAVVVVAMYFKSRQYLLHLAHHVPKSVIICITTLKYYKKRETHTEQQ